jgi:crotonobetainyl-CoA:carnitine CoA-transferase CaiB-like acyl-CoA transferase
MSAIGGALEGIRVLDLTRVFAGPFASQILGDLGADVIKVERYGRGDECRDYAVDKGKPKPGAPFLAHNRNKRSLAVDLKQPAGAELLLKLADSADVLMHNFRPGVMERLGLGYEAIATRNPRIIYGSISGFGSTGSLARKAANDLSIQGFAGLLSITGEPGGDPVRVPAAICDLAGGTYLVIGILAALRAREVTGRGQQVETSMLEGTLNYMNHFLTDYWLNGRVAEKMGTGNRLGQPNQAFPTKDGWVCIVAPNEVMWRRCAAGLGIPEAAEDPRFNTLEGRYAHRNELSDTVREATLKLTNQQVVDAMDSAGVPCVPVNSIPEIASHPVLAELGAFVDMPVEGDRTARLVQSALHMSVTPVSARLSPPSLGEHTDGVLREAGLTDRQIAELRESQVVM